MQSLIKFLWPISNIDKVVSFGGGDGLHEMGEAGLARTFDTIKETTGLDLVGLINETMATKQGNKEIVQAIESKHDDVQPVIVAEEK